MNGSMALIQLLQTVASMVGCFQYLQSETPMLEQPHCVITGPRSARKLLPYSSDEHVLFLSVDTGRHIDQES